MADDAEAAALIPKRSRKRKRLTPINKILPRLKVEVRSIEEGFEGSWHSATVTDCKSQDCVVRYDHIFRDNGSVKLVESVPVFSDNFRGRVRPMPPQLKYNLNCLHYGQCVDVFHLDAWWEGVIFDLNDLSDERLVFFPDIGDELMAQIKNIRLTQDWIADTDEWRFRGDWVFLKVLEELELEWPILVSVKQIWYELRMKMCFRKEIKEWMCEITIWKEPVREVIFDNLKLTMMEFFGRLKQEGNQNSAFNKRFFDSIVKLKPSFFESIVVSPAEDKLDDGDMGPPGFSKKVLSKKQSYQWAQMHEFGVSDPNLVVEPACCPDSVVQHYENTSQNVWSPPALMLKVRQHLLYLGWKIEMRRDCFKSKEGLRYRYTDITGKHYFSLSTVCAQLCKSTYENPALESYKPSPPPPPQPPQKREIMDVDSECGLQAVVDYCSVTSDETGEWKNKDVDLRVYRMRAKKHLFAVGWTAFYAGKMCNQVRYVSPSGKRFVTLRKACNFYMLENGFEINNNKSEGPDGQKKNKEKEVGKLVIKKKNGVLSIKEMSKRNESFLNSTDEGSTNSSRKSRVLRSSKRARKDISPKHQTPRTILTWLLDNGVLVPRSKVLYRCQKNGHTLKEGRVTREGIKCSCCQTVFSISKFESHAGSSYKRPSANIFLEDGRSLLDCQLQLKTDQKARLCKTESHRLKGNQHKLINDNDYICSVCHYGGELVLCDQCPSSFHTHCLGLKDVPEGDWFCPSCCCRICNQNKFSDCEQDPDGTILNCEQCERRYHIGCLKRKEGFLKLESYPQENWFCSMRCEEIYSGIKMLLGKLIPTGRDDLTWTILKHKRHSGFNDDTSNTDEMTECYSKLNLAVSVMHECFEPVKEPRTQRDIVEDVIFCRWSELNRLNFKGFYTVLLEKDDELVSAATIRIYGEKVAELPLIGTRFLYRRRGMCHALMNVLEKKLVELGVERLVLPAVPSVLHTWTSSFGFSVMTEAQKLEFLGYTFLDFQGTHMCQKLLVKTPPSSESSKSRGNNYESVNGCNVTALDGISAISEVSQAERVEDICQCNLTNNGSSSAPCENLADQPSHVECQSEISMEESNAKEDDKNDSHVKCYQRRKIVACES